MLRFPDQEVVGLPLGFWIGAILSVKARHSDIAGSTTGYANKMAQALGVSVFTVSRALKSRRLSKKLSSAATDFASK